MSQPEKWTIRELLSWTVDYFKKKGVESPRLEAETLLSAATGMSRIDLLVSYDEEPTDTSRAAFRDYVRRRASGEPNAYISVKKEFYSLEFEVDRNVLIPRPDTEQLVMETIEYFKSRGWTTGADATRLRFGEDGAPLDAEPFSAPAGPTLRICDLGAGSGCVSAALAKNIPSSRVVGLDVSASALEVARRNIDRLGLSDRVTLLESDLFGAIPEDLPEEERFDAIVSNPPYVSDPEYSDLEATVRDFEPRVALLGGPTGAELPIELVRQASPRLKRGGRLALELSPSTVDAVSSALEGAGLWRDIEIRRDLSKLRRFVVAILRD